MKVCLSFFTEGNFGQFLNMLSLLMTNEVKEALKAFFDISKIQSSENVGNGDFCKLMAKKGIVSQISIEPLLVVLKECGEGSVAKISDTLFKLYKEGKLGETDTPERAKGIYKVSMGPELLYFYLFSVEGLSQHV